MTTQDLVTLGALLRAQRWATAYRLVNAQEPSVCNCDNINAVSKEFGIGYAYSNKAGKGGHWIATYARHIAPFV